MTGERKQSRVRGDTSGDAKPTLAELDVDEEAKTEEVDVPNDALAQAAAPTEQLAARERAREALEQAKSQPLQPKGFLRAAQALEAFGAQARAALMRDIAHGLEGHADEAPAPRLLCTVSDRAGLRHPILRAEEGELLSLSGMAFCALFPGPPGRAEFRLDAGPHAGAVADAMLCAIRVLGLRAPELSLAERLPAPFVVDAARTARIWVSSDSVRRPTPEAVLRFFAGRALFGLHPELLALGKLSEPELTQAAQALEQLLRGVRPPPPLVKALQGGLGPRAVDRLRTLYTRVGRLLHWPVLRLAAQHSMNRAGLVVSGSASSALVALRRAEGSSDALAELVRFAASERYFRLISRQAPFQ